MPIQQEEFEERVRIYEETADVREQFYKPALELIDQGYEIEAYILILATWNFAGFRYILRDFDLDRFRSIIREIKPDFDSLRNERIKDADFGNVELCERIKNIYRKLKEIVKQTGASKIMHFKNCHLFVMWDTGIRRMYGITNEAEPEDYILFLKKMKTKFGTINWEDENREQTLAKAIDEYNYIEANE